MREAEIEKLRGVVRDCVSKHLYSSAIFFADKVAGLTNDPADVYMQAQSLFLGRHFRRAYHLLHASLFVLHDLRFRYLAAKCLVRTHTLSLYISLSPLILSRSMFRKSSRSGTCAWSCLEMPRSTNTATSTTPRNAPPSTSTSTARIVRSM